jgi:hypothetical protein
MPKRDFMKNTCDGSGFTFTGLNGQDYGYNNSGQPCAIGVQTTVPYNPPTLLGNSNMFQPYQPNPRTGSMFGSSGGGYVGVAEHHAITSNPHSGGGGASSGSFIPNVPTPHNVHTSAAAQSQAVTNYTSKTPSYTAQEMIGWLEHMNNTQNLQFNLPYKEINLSGKNVTDGDMLFFAQRMSNFAFHLDNLQLNHNPFGDPGIQALFNCAFTVPLGRSVVHLKLNNCNFGDVGAELIAAYVRDGYMPATRSIDLHGNNITDKGANTIAEAMKTGKVNNLKLDVSENKITEVGDGYLAEAIQGAKVRGGIIIVTHKVEWTETGPMLQFVKNIRGPFNETVDALIDGTKKQGTLVFGTKEAKQAIIEGWLESAQSKGVDTKNVVVSKNIFEALGNTLKLGFNFNLGWVKCSVVPKDVKSFAADKILATASPEAGVIKTGIDIALCYFESSDEEMTSQRGVQFLGDLGLLPQGDFVDAIE